MKTPTLVKFLKATYDESVKLGMCSAGPEIFSMVTTPIYYIILKNNAFETEETFMNFMVSNYEQGEVKYPDKIKHEHLEKIKTMLTNAYKEMMKVEKDSKYYLENLISVINDATLIKSFSRPEQTVKFHNLLKEASDFLKLGE